VKAARRRLAQSSGGVVRRSLPTPPNDLGRARAKPPDCRAGAAALTS
jgi:hypothetical protein